MVAGDDGLICANVASDIKPPPNNDRKKDIFKKKSEMVSTQFADVLKHWF